MGVQTRTLHLFGGVVIGLKPHGREGQLASRINVRMSNIDSSVEHGRFTEYNVFFMSLVSTHQVFDALKPYQIDHTRSIREVCHQPALTAFTQRFETKNLAFQLNVRHIAVYLMHVIKTASIYIFIGEIIQEVVQGKDVQFLIQHSSPLRTNPLQVFYVACGQVEHNNSANFKSNGVVNLMFSRLPSTK